MTEKMLCGCAMKCDLRGQEYICHRTVDAICRKDRETEALMGTRHNDKHCDGYAVLMEDKASSPKGFWFVGIWHDRDTAEEVMKKHGKGCSVVRMSSLSSATAWRHFKGYTEACGVLGRDGVKVNGVSFAYYMQRDGSVLALPLAESEAKAAQPEAGGKT